MILTSGRLNESQLRRLSEEHDRLIDSKHRWCWKEEVLPLINFMRQFNPLWSDNDLFERVGDTYIDWLSQEFADEVDWDTSFEEIIKKYQLNQNQINQLKLFLTGIEAELDDLISPQ